MTSNADSVFLDTNVLVYANVKESPLHQLAIKAIQYYYDIGVELWISRQVLREYIAVLTRPQIFVKPVSISIVSDRIRFFQTHFQVAEENHQITEELLALIERFSVGGNQIHDANIVATMQVYGIHSLVTHNISDFRRFSDIIDIISIG
ncbi:TPA: PIN domain-containing protein [bacterium]|nr:PIN domain-containing protein [bacterium]